MKQNQKGVKMKKHALLLTLVIAVLSMSLVAQEIKISGEMWNRWTMDSGTTAADTMNTSIRSNTLSLERGYFGLEAPRRSRDVLQFICLVQMPSKMVQG